MPITVEYANNEDGKFSLELEQLGRDIADQFMYLSGDYCDVGSNAGKIRYNAHNVYLTTGQVEMIEKIRKSRIPKGYHGEEEDVEQSEAETTKRGSQGS